MKILQVCLTYGSSFGGTAEHVRNISERLVRGYDVTVACTDPSGMLLREEIINHVRIRRFKSWAPGDAYFFSNGLRQYLKERSCDFDIVHAHNYHAFPALYAAQAKASNGLVFTPHYHGAGATFVRNLLNLGYKYIAKQIFDKADWVVCVSEYEKNLIATHFQVDQNKVALIPNGVDLDEFRVRSSSKDKKDSKVILCVARLEKYKGVDYVISAFARLSPDIRLEIVGTGSHRESLERLATRLMVDDRVAFSDHLPRDMLLEKYREADLFILLSRHEAYGIVVGEALASGTPCIVANTSALREWVDEENCFGIDYPVDVGRLTDMINKTLGGEVRPQSIRLPTWDKVVEMLISVYEGTPRAKDDRVS